MNNRIYKIYTICITLLITGAFTVTAEAQQADRDIPQQFLQEYQEIEGMIHEAETMGDLRATQDRVNQFLNDYRDQTGVINRAIYPETVGGKFEDLRVNFMAMQAKIRTIRQQDRSIERLRSELTRTHNRMERYDHHISWLLDRVVELENRALAAETEAGEGMHEALRERDRLVTEFLTDLLERYESVDAAARGEITDMFERLDDTPVDLLQTVLDEHITNAQGEGQTPTDLLNMKAQYEFFNNWWERFGDRVVNTFVTENTDQVRNELNDRMSTWSNAIDGRLWDSLAETYTEQGFELPEFSSSQEFYNAHQEFIREQTEIASSQNSEEDIERFRNYSDFWNESVKSGWGDALTTSAVLSHSQIASIDRMLLDWGQEAVPPAQTGNLMLILLLISVAVNIGLVVALVRRNDTPSTA